MTQSAPPPGGYGHEMRGLERKWWTLIVVCTAVFMLLLDITVVNVALPDMQHDLHASFSQLQWVVDAYALALATLVLTAGSLSDIVGRRLVFTAGLAIFVASSAACGASPSAGFLIGARAAQGLGGAIMFATSLALIAGAFQGRDRGVALGIWGATIGAAAAVGPLVGGLLTQGLGWRWIFFVNIPIGAVAIIGSVLRLAESRDPSRARVDVAGTAALTGFLFLLVYGLLQGNGRGLGEPDDHRLPGRRRRPGGGVRRHRADEQGADTRRAAVQRSPGSSAPRSGR